MTQQRLQQLSSDVRRQASREYMRRRVELTAGEVRRETDEEIRRAVREVCGAASDRNHDLGSPAFD